MENGKDPGGYFRVRGRLRRTAEAVRRGHVTIAFVGGSITEPANGARWSDKVVDWFVARFPGLTVDVENAAKGATGTLSALLYVEDEVIPYAPDLIFIETAVNDHAPAWGPAREGMLRKLLAGTESDLVLTYTYCQAWYEEFLSGGEGESILDWEKLAEHYGISSVGMSRYAFDLVNAGFLKWEEWLPDGLHPADAGSRIYSEPVCALLERELGAPAEALPPRVLPAPLYPDHWGGTFRFPLEDVERHGAWRLVRERKLATVSRILFTASMTSSLTVRFTGRGFVLRHVENNFHAAFRFRTDGGKWVTRDDPVPEWALECCDWVREEEPVLLPEGEHVLEIRPVFGPGRRGTSFELTDVAVIR